MPNGCVRVISALTAGLYPVVSVGHMMAQSALLTQPCPKQGSYFGCLKGVSKSVQILLNDKEATLVLALIILT